MAVALTCMAPAAWADQQGHYDAGQSDTSHASMTTAAGTSVGVAVEPLITDPQAVDENAVVQRSETYHDLWRPFLDFSSEVSTAKTGLLSTTSRLGQWTYPEAWEHDQEWHPAVRVTLTFDAPVRNPTLDVRTLATQLRSEGGAMAVSASATQVRLAGVVSSRGTQLDPAFARAADSWGQLTSGTYVVTTAANGNPVLTPGLIRGQIPYYNAHDPWCGTGESTVDFSGRSLLTSRYSGLAFTSGACTSLTVDTHGEAASSVVLELDQTYASANDQGRTWNFQSFVGAEIVPVIAQELSGVGTPDTLGVASHAVSDLRIGDDIVAARADKISDAMLSPTAASNSDAGYAATSTLRRAPLRAGDTGEYPVTVPYSHVYREAYLNGWIDFNGNGQWDAGESATPVRITPNASGSGTATLEFDLPGSLKPRPGGVTARFRLAGSLSEVGEPTGYAASGEVEDHSFVIASPQPKPDPTTPVVPTDGTAPATDGVEPTVAQPDGPLPVTGARAAEAVGLALALLTAGIAVLVGRRLARGARG